MAYFLILLHTVAVLMLPPPINVSPPKGAISTRYLNGDRNGLVSCNSFVSCFSYNFCHSYCGWVQLKWR